MNENQIGAGLARLAGLQSEQDDRRLASKIIARDRRRVWLLSGLAVVFWAIAAAGVFFVVYAAMFHLYPKQQQLMRAQVNGNLTAQQLIEIQALHFRAVELCTLVVAASFIAATLAAICTLLLILVSRHATLTQINLSLARIFELLEQPTAVTKNGPRSEPNQPG